MEFYYQSATLLYYINCCNNRKYYLDKYLKHKSISLSLSRCCLSTSRFMSKWTGRVDLFQLKTTELLFNFCSVCIIYKCGHGPHNTSWQVGDPCCRQLGKDKRGQGCQHVWAELYYLVGDSGRASEHAWGGALDSGYSVHEIRVAQTAY
jgi:hypothetical protein